MGRLFRDFNLEKKIEALPSLSLEEFQEKKKQQRTKKKKIPQKLSSNFTKRSHPSIGGKYMDDIFDPQEEAEKALLVGSQKRKARKQSITRNAAATTSASKNGHDQDANKRKYIKLKKTISPTIVKKLKSAQTSRKALDFNINYSTNFLLSKWKVNNTSYCRSQRGAHHRTSKHWPVSLRWPPTELNSPNKESNMSPILGSGDWKVMKNKHFDSNPPPEHQMNIDFVTT